MPVFIDLSGQVFGRLTVIRKAGNTKRIRWECRCICGNKTFPDTNHLKSGHTRSCGCLSAEIARQRGITHGHTIGKARPPEYLIWSQMIQRTTNPRNKAFKDYGGRGITICEEWKIDFAAFFAHVGPRPSPKHSIDRIKNELGYFPGNVRWSTAVEQGNNTRRNRFLTYKGRTQTVSQWAREIGLRYHVLYDRLHKLDWSKRKALTTPRNEKSVRHHRST